jgi:hypothetical protein
MSAFRSLFGSLAMSTSSWIKKHRPPFVKSCRQPNSGGTFHQSCVKKR